jgi:4-amino-4-deoxy-L-arabinose transferase-like glycosyltransferase
MPLLKSMTNLKALPLALVVAIACATFTINLGSARLWDEDEPRNARCAVEMMERQDWIVPSFNGELRTHKPILLYWFTIIAYHLLGVTEFSARAASATAGVATVACLFMLVDRLCRRSTATLAAVILSSAMMFVVAARAATPDSVLIFFMTLAITIYAREIWVTAPSEENDGLRFSGRYFIRRWPALLGFYAALGLAMLAKGPVGFVLPMAIIGMFLLIVDADQTRMVQPQRAGRLLWLGGFVQVWQSLTSWFAPLRFWRVFWSMRPAVGTAIALAVALPWYLAVGFATDGEWPKGFFLDHNLGRATRPMEGHGGSLLFYPLALCIGLFPWSNFLAASAIDFSLLRQSDRIKSRPIILGICWIVVPMVLFSFSSTKLPSYISPGYPGIAIVIASFLARLRSGETQVHRFWQQLSYGIGGAVGLVMIPGLIIAAINYLPGDEWLAVIALPLCIGGVLAFELNRRQLPRPAFYSYAFGATTFAVLLFAVGAPTAAKHREIDSLTAWTQTLDSGSKLAAYGAVRSSWVFYADQTIRVFDERELSKLAEYLQESNSNFLLVQQARLPELRSKLSIECRAELELPLFPNVSKERLLVVRANSGHRNIPMKDDLASNRSNDPSITPTSGAFGTGSNENILR